MDQPNTEHRIPKAGKRMPFRFRGYSTRLGILVVDLGLSMLSFGLACLAVLGFELAGLLPALVNGLAILLAIRLGVSLVFKTNSLIIRYIGEKDLWRVVLATTVASLVFLVWVSLQSSVLPVARYKALLLVDHVILVMLLVGFRFELRRLHRLINRPRQSRLNTVIFGAGEMGAMVEQLLRQNRTHDYRVVAFFDDNPRVHKKFLNGIRIYNPDRSFREVLDDQQVKVAILAIKDLPESRRIDFINRCLDEKVRILKLPPPERWIDSGLSLGQLRDIRFEDLLNRPPIQLDVDDIRTSLTGKVVLVTGCAGSIGSEIVRQVVGYRPTRVIGIDQAESPLAALTLEGLGQAEGVPFTPVIGNIQDEERMRQLFEEYEPHVVFHAAAYKHVPVMEAWPREAIKTNVEGTRLLADLASAHSVERFVMISTDKAVNPGNVMGASKRIAEMYVQALMSRPENTTRFITTRFGNVLGSNGSVVPIFRDQIEGRQPVTVTHPEVTRYFMTIPEACQLVLEAGALGEGGEIFVFDMGEPVKIVDLARKMIQMAGLVPGQDIEIRYTGLRPGEKLYEELLDDGENLLNTHHPKIMRARTREYALEEVVPLMEELISQARTGTDGFSLVRLMKELVPEFSSTSSDYAILDERTSGQTMKS